MVGLAITCKTLLGWRFRTRRTLVALEIWALATLKIVAIGAKSWQFIKIAKTWLSLAAVANSCVIKILSHIFYFVAINMVFATQWCIVFDTFCNDKSRGNSRFCHGFMHCICRFCNDRSRGNMIYCHLLMCCIRYFYYHDLRCCFTTLDLVAIASVATIRCCGNIFFPRIYLVAKVYIATQRFGGNCIFCHHKYL